MHFTYRNSSIGSRPCIILDPDFTKLVLEVMQKHFLGVLSNKGFLKDPIYSVLQRNSTFCHLLYKLTIFGSLEMTSKVQEKQPFLH